MRRLILYNWVLYLSLLVVAGFAENPMLPEINSLKKPISFEKMQSFLERVAAKPEIEVQVTGRSVSNHPLYLVHISTHSNEPKWKLFFYGQQHGNEPAGKDALLYLIQKFYMSPHELPPAVDLWIMPMVNPDGAIKDKRRNDNDADLNRDHQLLFQPETQILHQVFRKIMPHVAVDCHEFTRDSRDYTEQGWQEWPLIMMDCGNNPMIDPEIYKIGQRWCEQVKPVMLTNGHNYTRYYVGGVPPQDELRYSTPEMNDGRNGFAAYGGLSFIIESGMLRNAEVLHQDLKYRIPAYLELLSQFIYDDTYRSSDIAAIERSRAAIPPHFIPTNYFWANREIRITEVPVIDKNSKKILKLQTANFMHDLMIKNSVRAPLAYLVAAKHEQIYRALLDKHGLHYTVIGDLTRIKVERCVLQTIETTFDSLYSRYGGRQIMKAREVQTRDFQPGSLRIQYSRRAAMLLEPLKLYGLYENEKFYQSIDDNAELPVYRQVE